MTASAYGPFRYSPIVRRPPFAFPNGARVAVWLIPNIEFFPLGDRIPPTGGAAPDVPNWSIRDYGNRIGIFRLMEVMDRYRARGTVALNSAVCDFHPEIIEECQKRGWEFMGHNETNTKRLNDPSLAPGEDAAIVQRTVARIAQATGRAPTGWLGAGLQENRDTLPQLLDAGIEYVADWCNDDQPYRMTLADGRTIASVPYSYELNDKVACEINAVTSEAFSAMIRRQFDVLWREGETQARVMPIALHPYITGVAHRIGALDSALEHICRHDGVWLATGAELAAVAREL
jgi:allantoinase